MFVTRVSPPCIPLVFDGGGSEFMKSNSIRIIGAAALGAGLILAQTAQPAPATPGQAQGGQWAQRRAQMRRNMVQRFSTYLNLSADQQTQARQIFQAARQSAQPVAQQLREARKALDDAVKANASDAQIDQLSANIGNLVSQLTAIRTKAFEKFYGILTPEQKDKMNTAMDRFVGRRGMRPAAFRGRRAQDPEQLQ
jgi:Spy/CpxP family protein refolding chaperone